MPDDSIPPNPVTEEWIQELLTRLEEGRQPPLDPLFDKMINECLMCKRDKRDKATEPCNHCRPLPKYPQIAPEGQVFVCGACGKTAKNLYGDPHPQGDDSVPTNWDESCVLNAVLCKEDSLEYKHGRIVKADAVEGYA